MWQRTPKHSGTFISCTHTHAHTKLYIGRRQGKKYRKIGFADVLALWCTYLLMCVYVCMFTVLSKCSFSTSYRCRIRSRQSAVLLSKSKEARFTIASPLFPLFEQSCRCSTELQSEQSRKRREKKKAGRHCENRAGSYGDHNLMYFRLRPI